MYVAQDQSAEGDAANLARPDNVSNQALTTLMGDASSDTYGRQNNRGGHNWTRRATSGELGFLFYVLD